MPDLEGGSVRDIVLRVLVDASDFGPELARLRAEVRAATSEHVTGNDAVARSTERATAATKREGDQAATSGAITAKQLKDKIDLLQKVVRLQESSERSVENARRRAANSPEAQQAAQLEKAHVAALEAEKRRIAEIGKAQGQALELEKKRVQDQAKLHGQALDINRKNAATALAIEQKKNADLATAHGQALEVNRRRDAADLAAQQKQNADMAREHGQALEINKRYDDAQARMHGQAIEENKRHNERLRRLAEQSDRDRRRRVSTFGGAIAEFVGIPRSYARDFADVFQQITNGAGKSETALRRVSMTFSKMRQDAKAVSAAGGGGGGGFFTNLLGGLGDMADNVGDALSRLAKNSLGQRFWIAVLISAIGPLIAAFGAVGAAALAVGNTMVSLAGSVAALPGLFAAAATGLGALVVAFQPLSAAFKAFTKLQQAQAEAAASNGRSQQEAADKVADAHRTYNRAAREIVDAQRDERRAQRNLNDARREATRDLENLRAQLARTSLDEEGAVLAVKRALDDYRRALADPTATNLDREEALHRYKQSEQDLLDLRTKNKRLVQDAAEAERRGVEGSDRVLDARSALADVQDRVAASNETLAKAARDLRAAQAEQQAGSPAILKAQQELNASLAKMGPNTRAVANAIFGLDGKTKGLADRWAVLKKQVAESVFGPIVGQLGKLNPLVGVLETLLSKAGAAMGGVIAKGIAMVSSGPWTKDFNALADNNAKLISTMGDAGLSVADAFRHITMAAAPFTQWIADTIKRLADDFDRWAESGRKSGSIARFLDMVKERIGQVMAIAGNLFSVFKSVFFASSDFTGDFLDKLIDITGQWKAWGKEQEGPLSSFRQWLERTKPLLKDIWHFVSELVKSIAKIAADPHNIREAQRIFRSLADDVLPALVGIITKLSESQAISKVVEAIGGIAKAVQGLLDAGGGTALTAFATGIEWTGKALGYLLQLGPVANILGTIAVALGILAGASLFARFTGLLKVADLLRTILRLRRTGGVGAGLLDILLGRDAGTTALNRQAKALGVPAGSIAGTGGVVPHLTRIERLLGRILTAIETCCAKLLRAAGTSRPSSSRATPGTVAPSGSRGTGRATSRATPGSVAPSGSRSTGRSTTVPGRATVVEVDDGGMRAAARALDGAAVALDRSAAALLRAAAALARAAGVEVLDDLGTPIVGGTGGGKRTTGTGGGAEKAPRRGGRLRGLGGGLLSGAGIALDVLALGQLGSDVAKGNDIDPLSALFAALGAGDLARRAAPTVGRVAGRVAPSLGRLLPSLGGGGLARVAPMLTNPVTATAAAAVAAVAGGAYLGSRSDTRPGDVFGGSRTLSQGFSARNVGLDLLHFSPLGQASFLTSKAAKGDLNVGENVGKAVSKLDSAWDGAYEGFMRAVGSPLAKFFTETLPKTFHDLPGRLMAVLRDLPDRIGDLAHQAGVRVGRALRAGFLYLVRDLPKQIARLWSAAYEGFMRHVGSPIAKWFRGIPKFFTETIPKLWSGAYEAFMHAIGSPVAKWVRGIPRFFTESIPNWFKSLPRWFEKEVKEPVQKWILGIPKFFTESLPNWFKGVGHWLKVYAIDPVWNWIKGIPRFFTETLPNWFSGVGPWFNQHVVEPVVRFIGSIPARAIAAVENSAPVQFLKGIWEGVTGHASGGLVTGAADGRADTKLIRVTPGEHITRKRVVDKPAAKRLLADLNEERIDPAQIYAALNIATRSINLPANLPTNVAASAVSSVVNNSSTTNRSGGLHTGDITINNPVRERSNRSMRRTLQTLALLGDR